VDLVLLLVSIATPLLVTAAGETVAQRAGIVNLGLDGELALGAFLGWLVAGHSIWPIASVLAVGCLGALWGLLRYLLLDTFRLSQVLLGVGGYVLAGGLANSLFRLTTRSKTPGLLKGSQFDSIIVLVALLTLIGAGYLLLKRSELLSRLSLAWQQSGDDPSSAWQLGVPTSFVRAVACIVSSQAAFTAGAVFSVLTARSFQIDYIQGRGFAVLGLIVIGRWSLVRVIVLVCGWSVLGASQFWLQIAGRGIPTELIQGLPFAVPLVWLAVSGTRSHPPRGLMQDFVREADN